MGAGLSDTCFLCIALRSLVEKDLIALLQDEISSSLEMYMADMAG